MPAMDPFEVLTQETAVGARWIEQLRRAALSIRAYGFSADSFAMMSDAVVNIESALRRHDEIEDQYLFPLLEAHVPDSVGEMRRRRRHIWRSIHELRSIVREIEDGHIYGSTVQDLVHVSEDLVDLVSSHLADEDTVLAPLTREKLTPSEYAQLAANIARYSHPEESKE
jgi:hemerythrin-like domain-containing protein